MNRQIRSAMRYILGTGDLPLDIDQTMALLRICQDRISWLSQGQGYYLHPALDPDREDMWFVSLSEDSRRLAGPRWDMDIRGPYELQRADDEVNQLNRAPSTFSRWRKKPLEFREVF